MFCFIVSYTFVKCFLILCAVLCAYRWAFNQNWYGCEPGAVPKNKKVRSRVSFPKLRMRIHVRSFSMWLLVSKLHLRLFWYGYDLTGLGIAAFPTKTYGASVVYSTLRYCSSLSFNEISKTMLILGSH